MDSRKLWNARFQAFLQLFLQYMRLILNSGLLFSLLFAVVIGSYYYILLLKQIPDGLPVSLLIAIVMTYALAKVNVRTFLKKADLVYLLPAEERMKSYFAAALIYNASLQMAATLLIAIVFAPLYAVQMDEHSHPYAMIVVLLMLIKLWNVIVHWQALKLNSSRLVMRETILRVFATFVSVYLLLIGADAQYLLIVGGILLAFLLYAARKASREHLIKWERLLDHEQQLAARFYKFVNAFVDVPALTQRVKPRKWSKGLASFLRHHPASVPYILYIHAFFRSGQYFGIYVRLAVIGAIVLAVLPFQSGKLFGAVLFIYLTAVQLLPLQHHFSAREMLKLYPIDRQTYVQRFQHVILTLLIAESILFFAVILAAGDSSAWTAGSFLIVNFAIFLYVKKASNKKVGTTSNGL